MASTQAVEAQPKEPKEFSTRAQYVGLTYSRCPVDKVEMAKYLLTLSSVKGVEVAHELHKDGGDHLHAMVHKTRALIKDSRFFDYKENDNVYHPSIHNLNVGMDVLKWHRYIQKEDRAHVEGEFREPQQVGRKRKAAELVAAARSEGVHKVIADMISEDSLPLDKVQSVKKGLELATERNEDYFYSSDDEEAIEFTKWQQALWTALDQKPRRRTIHWVSGPPKTGKSTMADYIIKNHPGRAVNFFSKAKLDDCIFSYNREGVCIWDFPKAYDWSNMAKFAAATIEKFSDYGSTVRCSKYHGKELKIRCHVVVFSNHPCIDELYHRDIVEYHTGCSPKPRASPGEEIAIQESAGLDVQAIFEEGKAYWDELRRRREEEED